MTSNKSKGTDFETRVRRYLNELGIDAYRPYASGLRDTGDLHGVDPFTVQLKSYRNITDGIREGLAGAERQKKAAGQPYGAAIVARPGRGAAEAYVVMHLDTFADIIHQLRCE